MLLTSTSYLGPVQLYAHIYAADRITEDRHEHFVKQTYRNRCYIATPTGAQPLTIPIVRNGASHTATRDVRISDHGNWRHLHWTAIASAYESSPYFEYYADDFRPLFERPFDFLVDFNEALQHTVLSLLSIDKPVTLASHYVLPEELSSDTLDTRMLISPKQPLEADQAFRPVPYYQVFGTRTGFIPNLSIIDLLFNLGPESRMVLKHSKLEGGPLACE